MVLAFDFRFFTSLPTAERRREQRAAAGGEGGYR